MFNRVKPFESDFDWDRLHQLAERDTDFEIELLQIFLEDLEQSLVQLTSAIATWDADTLEQVAHSVRGAAANVGAVGLAQTAAQLEQIGQQKQRNRAGTLLGQLQTQAQAVRQHLQRAKVITTS